MIKLLDDLSLLEPIAKAQPYFGSLLTAAATAAFGDLDLMTVWVELDGHGKSCTALDVKSDSVTVCTANCLPGKESLMFLMKLLEGGNIKTVECDKTSYSVLGQLLTGAQIEEAVQMVLKKPAALSGVEHEVRTEGNIDDVSKLMSIAFGEKEKSDLELWYFRMMRSINRGQTTMFTLYENGNAVSTASIRGRTKKAGAITSVVTLPEYRGKGYASYLTALCANMLLEEGRKPYLVPANPGVQKMYEKLGFKVEKPYYYIELKSEENTK